MFTILTILMIIGAILLIVAVLLQPGKGDLTATFGGLSAQFGQVFGMTRANDLLAKITRYIAIAIFVLAIIANKFFLGGAGEGTQQQVRPVTEGVEIPTSVPSNINQPALPKQAPAQQANPQQGTQQQQKK